MSSKTLHITRIVLVLAVFLPTFNLTYAQISEQEKRALLDLYEQTDGENWKNSWNLEESVLNWEGVKIKEGTVVVIDLFNNNLVGVLPESIGEFKNLTHLNVAFNGITGELPKQLIQITALRVLKLEMNRIKGELPETIGQLEKLEELTAFNNFLTGHIPEGLGSLKNLKVLNLSSNNLKGQIPNSLGSLSKLESLGLFENALEGTIPSEMGKLSNLKELVLANNRLGGAIPIEFGQLASLRILQIQNNRFESFNGLRQMNVEKLLAFDHDAGNDFNFEFDNPNKDKIRMADTKFEDDDIDNK
ncbi:hypothetical protein FEE95_08880 [Maribacter algarum]|uniref:Disease resistance R13L4/SHOC-2-like LRR domain-containing protein n=1 Tax=Maribacter algarum (ex Zhang et al. 2020) TaxID=2578118 RepID=A0A5S3PXD0_9FLAO|nr:leucine-rich repeat domain-containing protein [Maribacter algarum]TMM59520.1 hypothetical protein FEE95_08880 [Maribacter algarum]